jgi:hypothetical protein
MSSTIDCHVDTKPMAQSLTTVSHKVDQTRAAVIAMQAAVISAEQKAAEHVCENVNRGFYTLIQSQISQKVARLRSEVDSHIMNLNQQQKQLLAIRNRMERDYGMICSRYIKLFSAINKNLQQRVYELDKPTMNFAMRDVSTLSNRTKQLTATVPVAQLESVSVSQRILASNMKHRSMQAIESMNSFLSDLKQQEALTHSVIMPMKMEHEADAMMIPVIVSESNYDQFDNRRVDVIVNDTDIEPRSRDIIRGAVARTEMTWHSKGYIDNELRSEFNRIKAASQASDRVKNLAEKLFLANNFETLNR